MENKKTELTEKEMIDSIILKKSLIKFFRFLVLNGLSIILYVLCRWYFERMPLEIMLFYLTLVAIFFFFMIKESEKTIGSWTHILRKPTGETIGELYFKLHPS